MRHRTSPPLFSLWRRVPRAVAGSVATLAELSPVRAVLALVVTLGFGTSAAMAVASVGSGASRETAQEPVLTQRPISTASRSADRADMPPPSAQTPQGSASAWASPEQSRSPRERGAGPRAGKTGAASPSLRMSPSGSHLASAAPGTESSTPSSSSSPAESEGQTSSGSSDGAAPQTTVDVSFPQGDSAVFRFSADEPSSYTCTLDGDPYTPCDSPTSLSGVHPGWHTFRVWATDADGNVDPTPAEVRWHADAGSPAERSGP